MLISSSNTHAIAIFGEGVTGVEQVDNHPEMDEKHRDRFTDNELSSIVEIRRKYINFQSAK